MTSIVLGETCGIEYETEEINVNQIQNLRGDGWNLTNDASIESDAFMLNNGLVVRKNNIKNIPTRRITIGTEIVSGILDSGNETFKNIIANLTTEIAKLGENPQGLRSGIHFHFSLSNPSLRILKSILRLGRYFEALFYTIGCMGYEFRGLQNDSIYCRPITFKGPVCIKGADGNFYQCYNITDALKATSIEEFWNIFGDVRQNNGRYNPVRYSWLNLYPLCPFGDYRGTLEFRLFNKTINPLFIYSTAILCKKFLELVLASSFDTLKESALLKTNSIFNTAIDKDHVKTDLLTLVNMTSIEDTVVTTLINIINQSNIPYLPSQYVHTHLRRYNPFWCDSSYKPSPVNGREIKSPNFVDIHTLRGE